VDALLGPVRGVIFTGERTVRLEPKVRVSKPGSTSPHDARALTRMMIGLEQRSDEVDGMTRRVWILLAVVVVVIALLLAISPTAFPTLG
jgi:hypothetical protein